MLQHAADSGTVPQIQKAANRPPLLLLEYRQGQTAVREKQPAPFSSSIGVGNSRTRLSPMGRFPSRIYFLGVTGQTQLDGFASPMQTLG